MNLGKENLEKVYEFYLGSQFLEGIQHIDKYQQENHLSFNDLTDLQIWKLKFFEKLGRFDDSLLLSSQLLSDPQILAHPIFQCKIMIEQIKINYLQGNLDLMFSILENAEQILLQNTDLDSDVVKALIADLVLLKGGYYWQNGELNNALFKQEKPV